METKTIETWELADGYVLKMYHTMGQPGGGQKKYWLCLHPPTNHESPTSWTDLTKKEANKKASELLKKDNLNN